MTRDADRRHPGESYFFRLAADRAAAEQSRVLDRACMVADAQGVGVRVSWGPDGALSAVTDPGLPPRTLVWPQRWGAS